MAAQAKRKKSQQRADPNQLSLLDYRPSQKLTVAPLQQTKKPTRARRAKFSDSPQAVLTAKEAAHYLNLSPETLKVWRAQHKGPTVTKIGARLIGYKPADLDAFLGARPRI